MAHLTRSFILVVLALAVTAAGLVHAPCALASDAAPPACRVVGEGASTLEQLLDRLQGADVVLVGERHDSSGGHRLERAILEGLARRRTPVVLSLEMFERDVQAVLDGYLAGRVSEADFTARSRPWGNYARDYRPLVEAARARGLRVLAANVPRSIAAAVAARGASVLLDLPVHTFAWVARRTSAPSDEYRRAFVETMKSHPHGTGTPSMDFLYAAQCLKDDTMAETIADYLERAQARRPLLVHFVGGFHVDRNLGMVPRLRERRPAAGIVTVLLEPVSGLPPGSREDAKLRGRADYVVVYEEPR